MLLAVGNPTVDYMSLDIEGAEESVSIPHWACTTCIVYLHKNIIISGLTYHSLGQGRYQNYWS